MSMSLAPTVPARHRFGLWGRLFTLFLLLCIGFGLYAYAQQEHHGDIVTGARSIGQGGATWGLYIVFDMYFVGVSFAGIFIATVVRLFRIPELAPLSRIAAFLTIVSLIMGGLCVFGDLGRPLHGLMNVSRYARPTSPFFGDFSLVNSGYFFAAVVFFFLAGRADAHLLKERGRKPRLLYKLLAAGFRGTPGELRRHHRSSFWLSMALLPLLVAAYSTLGFVFGIQSGRPGWFSALQAPGFVILAGVSGIGCLIVVAALLRWVLRLEGTIQPRAFQWLGNMLLVLVLISLYFTVVEQITASYAAYTAQADLARTELWGTYAPLFWGTIGSLLIALAILFPLYVLGRSSIGWTVIAGIIVNFAAILKRVLIVIPSQTRGTLLPYQAGSYAPTWVEYGYILGVTALGCLLFMIFVKFFPVVVLTDVSKAPPPTIVPREPRLRRALRVGLFWATLFCGLVLAGVGFASCLRIGTQPYLDPVIKFSPVLFIGGLMICFSSAVVYELIPPAASRGAAHEGEIAPPLLEKSRSSV